MKPIFHRGGGDCPRENKFGRTIEEEAPMTRVHLECVHTWLSPVSVTVIVNTVAGCYFRRQSLVLNAVTPTRFCAMFDKEKSECFDNVERFTMSVTQVANCGEKFNDSGCVNKWKWEWISVEVEVKVFEKVKKECIGARFWKVHVTGAA